MAAAEQNNVIEGEAVVKQTVSSGSSRKNELPELPESMQKVKHTKKVELNELADYVADDYGEDKPKELSKLGRRKQYVEEEWPEREEYKSTNVMTLPRSFLNFDNFIRAFKQADMGRAFLNSFIIII